MADLKIVIKGLGDDFEKDPKGVFNKFGLLEEGEGLTAEAVAGIEPIRAPGLVHAHVIGVEAEAF